MSEIRSIAEGTFVLGDTNGLTFEAGTGIKITEPSEGTVRISNDETVLWSGEVTGVANELNLSEYLTNFERAKIYFYDVNGAQSNVTEVASDSISHSGWSRITCNEVMGHSDGTEYHRALVMQTKTAGDSSVWKVVASYAYSMKSTGMTGWDMRTTSGQTTYVKPWKIIGINRISGSNA